MCGTERTALSATHCAVFHESKPFGRCATQEFARLLPLRQTRRRADTVHTVSLYCAPRSAESVQPPSVYDRTSLTKAPQRPPRPTESALPWPKWPPPLSGVKSWSQLPAGSMWFSSQHVDSGRWLSSHGPMDVMQRAGHAGRRSSGSGLPKVNNPKPTTCATRRQRRGQTGTVRLSSQACSPRLTRPEVSRPLRP